MGLFGRTQEKSPKDMVTEWTHKLRKEGYALDRQVRGIQREEEKIKRSLKDAAKKGDKDVCTILAKEVIRARKAINKIQTTKAHINSVQLQMKNQLATLRVAGSLSKSTEVMNAMQNLLRLSDVSDTMRELSREMMKAGIIEEMLEETFEGMEDQDELEEEAQEQVDRILWEVTQGTLGKAPAAVTDTLPAAEPAASTSYEENEEELDDMRSRLAALRS
ncbi:Charged multivesicular body protein 3 [Polyplax serrata]|uniref:Charged multivesicular body protein 3 n=1 Tax=Polyplax serrata TaxID=468196 RepID=A0AAN8PIE2_POLSC